MNRSVTDVGGAPAAGAGVYARSRYPAGTRPSFTPAAAPEDGRSLFDISSNGRGNCHAASTGRFGADMKVSLINDGPVTFWLQTRPKTATPDNS